MPTATKTKKFVGFQPSGDRILVAPAEDDDMTPGGLYKADIAKEKPQIGLVVAVGPGKRDKGELVPLTYKQNDEVVFGKFAGSPITLDGIEYLILKDEEVFGTLVREH